MNRWRRGELAPATDAPDTGERIDPLVDTDGAIIEHILSGQLTHPVEYVQDRDEWVLVLEGSAMLDIEGEPTTVSAGEWLLLPATTRHRLLRTDPGTRWLAVHLDRAQRLDDSDGDAGASRARQRQQQQQQ